MSDEIPGQGDIFAELDEPAPTPPFTVYTCVWAAMGRCGWCGGKGWDGGGACRNPKDENESWYYDYCKSCRENYGYPHVTREGFALNIDRTQKPRPGGAPDFGKDAA
ncbi:MULTISPECIES: hypothetical protein [Arthrobacter]|uniref:Uncharacterized protein n=1 Tax=Arthrobacter terricola TaxID=2547396 RepID=A0A4R5KQB2_9MICC|nr:MULTISPECIES: hypothetical protein [Arthrobacter]MBT8161028.1 hypothetical protein [Arthrobacter sp. GN70]TDF96890.1 hypothetical protein E1809_09210 [Arthrobacter terricola]